MFLVFLTAFLFHNCEPTQSAIWRDTNLPLNLYTTDSTKPVMILFIDFNDFNCQPCFDNTIDFIDSIKMYYNGGAIKNVLVLVLSNHQNKHVSQKIIKGWTRGNSINIPTVAVSDTVFDAFNVKHTSVMILNKEKAIIEYEVFPVGYEKYFKLLNTIVDK